MNSRETGLQEEKEAKNYLISNGLEYVESNFTLKCGEIDLIMKDGNYIVFVEVRFRSRNNYGGGICSVTRHKQKKIIKTAKLYLQKKKLYYNYPCRFDVISISYEDNKKNYIWIKNAFLE